MLQIDKHLFHDKFGKVFDSGSDVSVFRMIAPRLFTYTPLKSCVVKKKTWVQKNNEMHASDHSM